MILNHEKASQLHDMGGRKSRDATNLHLHVSSPRMQEASAARPHNVGLNGGAFGKFMHPNTQNLRLGPCVCVCVCVLMCLQGLVEAQRQCGGIQV